MLHEYRVKNHFYRQHARSGVWKLSGKRILDKEKIILSEHCVDTEKLKNVF